MDRPCGFRVRVGLPTAGLGNACSVAGGDRDGGGWLADQLAKPHRLAAVVLLAAVLSVGALAGVASTVGFGRVGRQLVHPHWIWIPIALVCEVVAYLGYTLAYREIARVERGPELDMPKAAVMVTTGFGVFVRAGVLRSIGPRSSGPVSRVEARARVLGLGSLEYALLAPATALAALFLLIWHSSLDPSLTLPWVIGVPVGTTLVLSR